MVSRFAAVALGAPDTQRQSLLADIPGPAQQLSQLFDYQSYFDSTLLERALLEQRPNEQIVASTRREEQIPGYALALHPSSQTPVAVSFRVGGMPSSSGAIVLTPGQVVRPLGLPPGARNGNFSGFSWGLPYGWLGGGLATLVVLLSPDADVSWRGNPEVLFHRQRMVIANPGAFVLPPPFNWPMRFPWTQAVAGASSQTQRSQPVVAVEPTRVLLRLRTNLAAPADMRVLAIGSDDFDGADLAQTPAAIDMTWGDWTGPGYQVQELPMRMGRLGADDGSVALLDMSGGDLEGVFVDVVRYGRL